MKQYQEMIDKTISTSHSLYAKLLEEVAVDNVDQYKLASLEEE